MSEIVSGWFRGGDSKRLTLTMLAALLAMGGCAGSTDGGGPGGPPVPTGKWQVAAEGTAHGLDWLIRLSPARPEGICVDALVSLALGAEDEGSGTEIDRPGTWVSCDLRRPNAGDPPERGLQISSRSVTYLAGGPPLPGRGVSSYHYGLVDPEVESVEGRLSDGATVLAVAENGVFMFVFEEPPGDIKLSELVTYIDGAEFERCFLPAAPDEEDRYPVCR